MSENNLERFIERILQIQDSQKQQKLSQKELKDIAFEMGLNELDWRKIEETTNNHLIRAKGYMTYQNWEDAMKELDQAYPLNPQNTDLLYNMAYCYKMQWLNSGKELDKKQAEKYARQCLNFMPSHKDAVKLISSFKIKEIKEIKKSKAKYIILVLIILLGLLFLFLTLYQTSDMGINKEELKPAETVEIVKDDNNIEKSSNDIPVKWIKNKKAKGLDFRIENSDFSNYKKSYSYKASANIYLKKIELNELKLKIDLVANNNNIVQTKIKEVWSKYKSTLRNGDIIPFDVLIYVKEKMPQFKEVRITPYLVKKQFSEAKYEKSPKKEFKWLIKKPINYNVEIRERLSSFSGSGRIYHKLVLEFKNTGNTTVKKLKINLKWLDKNNKMLDNKSVYITISSQPQIQRGQTRIYGGTWQTSFTDLKNLGKYEIEIIEIE